MNPHQLQVAERFSKQNHTGQFRRDGVTPYFNHIEQVVARCKQSNLSLDHLCVAYLHDVIEDCGVNTLDLWREGFDQPIIDAVLLITKKEGQDYQEYLKLLAQNDLAKQVKIQDMLSNLSDNPSRNQIIKYSKGLIFLMTGNDSVFKL